jgi:hypothetical protein
LEHCLILQSSNTVWSVPGAAGIVNIAHGPIPDVTTVGTSLSLPLVKPPRTSGLFAS